MDQSKEKRVVNWGPDSGRDIDKRSTAPIESRVPVRLPLDSIFRTGADTRESTIRRAVLCYVVPVSGE